MRDRAAAATRALVALAAGLALAGPGGALPRPLPAQEAGLLLRPTGADLLDLDPGARGSVPVLIRNLGAATRAVRLTAAVPSGWRALVPSADLRLPPDSQALRIVGFFVPPEAPAGIHVLRLSAGGGASDSVLVRVAERPRLGVAVVEAPGWVPAGAAYTARFRIVNTGNIPATPGVRLESSDGLQVRADTTPRTLRPGASVVLEATVATRAEVAGARTHRLRLQATIPGAQAEATARVEVVPQGRPRDAAARAGLPGELRLRLGTDERAGAPLSLRVAASWRPGSATRVDLLLQGPADRHSVFGEADVYRLTVASPRYTLRLGDQVYGLSPLTTSSRAAFGAEARLRAGPLEVGGYLQRDRRSFSPDTQAGAFASLRLASPLRVGVSWMRDTGRGRPREVVAGSAGLRLGSWLAADAEYEERLAAEARAYSVHVRADGSLASVSLRHVRGDTAFAGSYGGVSLDAAHLSLRPWGRLAMDASVETQEVEHPFTGAVRSQTTERVGLRYGSRVAVEGLRTASSGPFAFGALDRAAHSARLRVGLPLGRLSLNPSAEVGEVVDPTASAASPFWKATLHANLRLPAGGLSGSLEYSDGESVFGGGRAQGASGSLVASLELGSRTRLQLGAYGTRYAWAGLEQTSLVGNGSLEHRFANGHRIAARVRSRAVAGRFARSETVALLDYVIPFALPTGGAGQGTVSGRVYDAGTGTPLARAIVSVGGRRVATDAEGRVRITGVEPGVHPLSVDRASIGLERTPSVPMPQQLAVGAGRTSTFEIAVQRAARLSVRVERAAAAGLRPQAGAAEHEPVSGVVLDITRDDQRIQRTTDERGTVELSDLRPGRWTVTAVAPAMPSFHRFQRDSVVVELAPGEGGEVSFTIVPVERRIRMIGTGGEPRPVQRRAPADAPAGDRSADAASPEAARGPSGEGARKAPDTPVATPAGEAPESRAGEAAAEGAGAPRAARAAPLPVIPAPEPLPAGWTTFTTGGSATTLREVARRLYLETGLWPKIWLANLEQIPDPDNLPDGLVLRIPPKAPLTREEERWIFEKYFYVRW